MPYGIQVRSHLSRFLGKSLRSLSLQERYVKLGVFNRPAELRRPSRTNGVSPAAHSFPGRTDVIELGHSRHTSAILISLRRLWKNRSVPYSSQRHSTPHLQCNSPYGIPPWMGISSMRRSSRSLDALAIPCGLTRQRLFSSIPTFWQLHIVTSRPVRPPFPQRHPVTSPTVIGSSDGVETLMNEGLPPGVEPFYDLEEWDLSGDFDGPIQEDPAEPQPQGSSNTSKRLQRSIKTYVVKDTAFRT